MLNYLVATIPFNLCFIGVFVATEIFHLEPSQWWFKLVPLVIGGLCSASLFYELREKQPSNSVQEEAK